MNFGTTNAKLLEEEIKTINPVFIDNFIEINRGVSSFANIIQRAENNIYLNLEMYCYHLDTNLNKTYSSYCYIHLLIKDKDNVLFNKNNIISQEKEAINLLCMIYLCSTEKAYKVFAEQMNEQHNIATNYAQPTETEIRSNVNDMITRFVKLLYQQD